MEAAITLFASSNKMFHLTFQHLPRMLQMYIALFNTTYTDDDARTIASHISLKADKITTQTVTKQLQSDDRSTVKINGDNVSTRTLLAMLNSKKHINTPNVLSKMEREFDKTFLSRIYTNKEFKRANTIIKSMKLHDINVEIRDKYKHVFDTIETRVTRDMNVLPLHLTTGNALVDYNIAKYNKQFIDECYVEDVPEILNIRDRIQTFHTSLSASLASIPDVESMSPSDHIRAILDIYESHKNAFDLVVSELYTYNIKFGNVVRDLFRLKSHGTTPSQEMKEEIQALLKSVKAIELSDELIEQHTIDQFIKTNDIYLVNQQLSESANELFPGFVYEASKMRLSERREIVSKFTTLVRDAAASEIQLPESETFEELEMNEKENALLYNIVVPSKRETSTNEMTIKYDMYESEIQSLYSENKQTFDMNNVEHNHNNALLSSLSKQLTTLNAVPEITSDNINDISLNQRIDAMPRVVARETVFGIDEEAKETETFDDWYSLYDSNYSKTHVSPVMYEDINGSLSYDQRAHNTIDQKNNNLHMGQLKLLLSEIQFLTKIVGNLNDRHVVVYAGGAPSNKGMYLAKYFPNIKWILVDPNPFDIKGAKKTDVKKLNGISDTFVANLNRYLKGETDLKESIYIVNELYTNDISKQLHKVTETFFICDIRTNMFEKTPTELDVMWNLAQQWLWMIILKPKHSLLKFRYPFTNIMKPKDLDKKLASPKASQIRKDLEDIQTLTGVDFVENYKSNQFQYMPGAIYNQAYSRDMSAETRLYVTEQGIQTTKTYEDVSNYEDKYFYMNALVRGHLLHVNHHADMSIGFDHCSDCSLQSTILSDYINKYGVNTTVRDEVVNYTTTFRKSLKSHGHGFLSRAVDTYVIESYSEKIKQVQRLLANPDTHPNLVNIMLHVLRLRLKMERQRNAVDAQYVHYLGYYWDQIVSLVRSTTSTKPGENSSTKHLERIIGFLSKAHHLACVNAYYAFKYDKELMNADNPYRHHYTGYEEYMHMYDLFNTKTNSANLDEHKQGLEVTVFKYHPIGTGIFDADVDPRTLIEFLNEERRDIIATIRKTTSNIESKHTINVERELNDATEFSDVSVLYLRMMKKMKNNPKSFVRKVNARSYINGTLMGINQPVYTMQMYIIHLLKSIDPYFDYDKTKRLITSSKHYCTLENNIYNKYDKQIARVFQSRFNRVCKVDLRLYTHLKIDVRKMIKTEVKPRIVTNKALRQEIVELTTEKNKYFGLDTKMFYIIVPYLRSHVSPDAWRRLTTDMELYSDQKLRLDEETLLPFADALTKPLTQEDVLKLADKINKAPTRKNDIERAAHNKERRDKNTISELLGFVVDANSIDYKQTMMPSMFSLFTDKVNYESILDIQHEVKHVRDKTYELDTVSKFIIDNYNDLINVDEYGHMSDDNALLPFQELNHIFFEHESTELTEFYKNFRYEVQLLKEQLSKYIYTETNHVNLSNIITNTQHAILSKIEEMADKLGDEKRELFLDFVWRHIRMYDMDRQIVVKQKMDLASIEKERVISKAKKSIQGGNTFNNINNAAEMNEYLMNYGMIVKNEDDGPEYNDNAFDVYRLIMQERRLVSNY
jgi:hypothetical protein